MSTSRESDRSRPPLTEDDAPVASPQAPLSLVQHHRQCWRDGKRLSVEAFLQEFPPPTLDDDDLLDLIYNEVVLREEDGESPELDEYLERFPQYAADLRAQFDVHRALQSGQPFTLNLSSCLVRPQTPGPGHPRRRSRDRVIHPTCAHRPPEPRCAAPGSPTAGLPLRTGLADARGLRHPGRAR